MTVTYPWATLDGMSFVFHGFERAPSWNRIVVGGALIKSSILYVGGKFIPSEP